jgi:hypothetical protein
LVIREAMEIILSNMQSPPDLRGEDFQFTAKDVGFAMDQIFQAWISHDSVYCPCGAVSRSKKTEGGVCF